MFIVPLARFCRLERLVGVPKNVVRLVVDPVGAARTAVTDRGELAVVAELAVDVAILSIVDGVVVQLFLAGGAGGALLVVGFAAREDFLRGEDPATAPGTVLLRVRGLEEAGVAGLEVDVGGADLRPELGEVAHLAVDGAVGAVVVLHRVELGLALDAAEAVLVVPDPVGRHHLLGVEHLALALGAPVVVVLVGLDGPRLDARLGQKVVLVIVETGQRPGPCQQLVLGPGAGPGAEQVGVARLAVDLPVGALAADDGVELPGALGARVAVAVEGADLGDALLGLEHLPAAPRAGVHLSLLSHDCLGVHPALVHRLGLVAKLGRVAVLAEDLSLFSIFSRAIVEGRGVKVAATFETAEAVFVERTRLGVDPLGLEHLPGTADAGVLVGLVGGEGRLLVVLVPAARAPVAEVADLAVDLVVRPLDGQVVVELLAALDARETLLVVQPPLGGHLLGLEHLAVAARAVLPLSLLARDDRGVAGDDVAAGPGDLVAADAAVEVVVRPDGRDGDVYGPAAVLARHALLVVEPALDLHPLGAEHGAVAARTGAVLVLRGDLGRVGVDQRGLVLGECLLEAGGAVDLAVRPVVDVLHPVERFGAFCTAETFRVPGGLS